MERKTKTVVKPDGLVKISARILCGKYVTVKLRLTQFYLADLYMYIFRKIASRITYKETCIIYKDNLTNKDAIDSFDYHEYKNKIETVMIDGNKEKVVLYAHEVPTFAKNTICNMGRKDAFRLGYRYQAWCKDNGRNVSKDESVKSFMKTGLARSKGQKYFINGNNIPQQVSDKVVERFATGEWNSKTREFINLGYYRIPIFKEFACILYDTDIYTIQRYLLADYKLKYLSLYVNKDYIPIITFSLFPPETGGFQFLRFTDVGKQKLEEMIHCDNKR